MAGDVNQAGELIVSGNLFEYIVFFDEPSKEEVLEAVNDEGQWELFNSKEDKLHYVAKDIAETNASNWELYDEDDYVYIAAREYDSQEWELNKISVYYIRDFNDEQIDLDDLD